jgi:hypothetical protein
MYTVPPVITPTFFTFLSLFAQIFFYYLFATSVLHFLPGSSDVQIGTQKTTTDRQWNECDFAPAPLE